MLDIQYLRKNLDETVSRLAQRHFKFDSVTFQLLETERRETQIQTEQLQAQRNNLSQQIGIAKSKGQDLSQMMIQVSQLADNLNKSTMRLETLQTKIETLMLELPNLPDRSVPVGKDANDNIEIRQWGEPRVFDFEIRDHVDLGISLGLDFDCASKISGTRFTLLKGQIARLHRALTQFMLDIHIDKHGYTEVYVPYIVNQISMRGTGQLPKFEEDLFVVPRHITGNTTAENFYLIPTAEVPLTNIVRDVILSIEDLPLKYVAHTPCFRSEAGSYGRDTRGMIRQHQFDKVELVQIVEPAQSMTSLEQLTAHAEIILQKLELPYRTVLLCTGDMGFASCKTYDIEVWIPTQQTYREISSCSNMSDFQARRIQARFRLPQGKPTLLHTLNGSGLAVGRTLVALLENHQLADRRVRIPEALQPYLGGLSYLTPI